MPSKRERVAALLDRMGLLDASLRTRRALGVPWLTVLSYHRLGSTQPLAQDPFDQGVMDASVADFDAQMAYLARFFTVIGVDEVCAALAGGPLPPNAAMVTFDDGYLACHDAALPVLRRHGLRATFFIATRFVEERRLFWWDRLARAVRTTTRARLELPDPEPMVLPTSTDAERATSLRRLQKLVKQHPGLDVDGFVQLVEAAAGRDLARADERRLADQMIMTWDQVRALQAAGQDIGSHTRTHRVLQTITDAELDDELRGSRLELEAQLGQPVRALAYPVGYSVLGDKRIVSAVERAGYQVAFTNASGINHTRRPHRLDVRRVATEYGMTMALFRASVALPTLRMILGWWRRRRAARAPFPAAWRDVLRADVPFYGRLAPAVVPRFEERLKIFALTKAFIGAHGFAIDDRVRVVIAASAARLALYLQNEHYQRLTEIIVHPTHYKHATGPGAQEGAVVFGEAHRHGTVVLSWEAVIAGMKNPEDGHDTALHEFAHVLDVSDGQFDGTPVLEERAAYAPWARVMSGSFLGLRGKKAKRKKHVLREYGATNEAEFFAVAAEAFFEKPRQLKAKHPELYALLADYFNCDPAAELETATGADQRAT